MKWTCYSDGLATEENASSKSKLTLYPNPVSNGALHVNAKNLNQIATVQIFDYSGKLVQTISQPFKTSNKIMLKNLPKGVYILKVGPESAKFIIQ